MLKTLEFKPVRTTVSVVEPSVPSQTLASNIAAQINNFIDKFESEKGYPPAIVALKPTPIKKKKKNIRIGLLEDMPPNKERRTRLHEAALDGDRRWLRFLCKEALDKEFVDADIYGKTPLHYAAENELLNEFVRERENLVLLLQIGDADGNTPLHIMALTKRFDKTVLADVKAHELKFLLDIRNIKNQRVVDIIQANGDTRLLAYLNSRS